MALIGQQRDYDHDVEAKIKSWLSGHITRKKKSKIQIYKKKREPESATSGGILSPNVVSPAAIGWGV